MHSLCLQAKTADLVTRVEQYELKTQALQDQKADLIGRNKMLLELLQERDNQIAELQAGRGMRPAHTLAAQPGVGSAAGVSKQVRGHSGMDGGQE